MATTSRTLDVLIVEDSRTDAELLLLELRRAGYQPRFERVETAATMAAAFDRQSWDIVIADYSLPHFSAPAALKLMQSRGLDLPFIIISGTVGEEAAVTALKAGAHDYIVKEKWARLAPAIERELREATEREARRQAERALQHRAAELAALHETTLDITRPYALSALLHKIVERATRLLNAPAGTLFLCDPDRQEIRCVVSHNHPRDYTGGVIKYGEGAAGAVAQTGQAIVVDNYRDWSGRAAVYQEAEPFLALLAAPLIWQNQVTGIINLLHPQVGHFSRADLKLLTMLADQAAVAVANAGLHEEVVQHASQLEQSVAERTAELTAANARLRELDQLKNQLVANVSHELRTPLSNIKGYLYLLDRGKPEMRGYYMETLHRETDLLQRLIEDLLELSRFDAGKARLELFPLDVNGLISMMGQDRARLLAERGLRLEFDLAPGLPAVWADARLIGQVFANLLTNAMNYTPAGGTITVSTGRQMTDGEWQMANDQQPTAISHQPPRWVIFSVRDTGPGISAEEQLHVFERFFRGEAAHTGQVPGTGLGLAICREIVNRHSGRLTLESRLGVGSIFTVWLPVGE